MGGAGWSRALDNSIGFLGCDSEEDGMTAGILWVTASVKDRQESLDTGKFEVPYLCCSSRSPNISRLTEVKDGLAKVETGTCM